FAVNAGTYLLAVAGMLLADFPSRVEVAPEERGMRRLVSGFRIAWGDGLVRRILVTMSTFSFFSLSFIYLMPTLASESLGMKTRRLRYWLVFAGFGVRAAIAAPITAAWRVRAC